MGCRRPWRGGRRDRPDLPREECGVSRAAKTRRKRVRSGKARGSISPAISAARSSRSARTSACRGAPSRHGAEIQRIARNLTSPSYLRACGRRNLTPKHPEPTADHKGWSGRAGYRRHLEAVCQVGGTLSGEHGIGMSKQPYMDLAVSKERSTDADISGRWTRRTF